MGSAPPPRGRRGSLGTLAVLVALTGCGAGDVAGPVVTGAPSPSSSRPAGPRTAPTSEPSPSATSATASSPTPQGSGRASPAPRRSPSPEPEFAAGAALADIRRLASEIGPREATSDSYAEAADLVERRLARHGYQVRRARVRVPAGNSWGTPVPRGTSTNVIAEPAGFDPERPHVVVGAHLDTIPVAPGAEDNASGVSVLLELARMLSAAPPEVPVQLIAFGAEEPRGSGDARHHFGSQQYVADLSRAERRAVVAMVALDRVGVRASSVPVCRAEPGGTALQRRVRAAGRSVDIPTQGCISRTSDHWSYAKVDVPAIRLGGVPYAGYHSRRDLPSVVDRRQLDRVGALMWAWLQDPR